MFRDVYGHWLLLGLFLGSCLMVSGCRSLSWHWPWRRATDPVDTTYSGPVLTYPNEYQGGSSTTSFKKSPSSINTLNIRDEVSWTIESDQGQRFPVMSGKTYVGPDGTLELGPYGRFSAKDLSIRELSSVLENHLQPYIRNPKVTLKVENSAQGIKPSETTSTIRWTSQKPDYSARNAQKSSNNTGWGRSRGWTNPQSATASTAHSGWVRAEVEQPLSQSTTTMQTSVSETQIQPDKQGQEKRKRGPIMRLIWGKE